MQAGPSRGRHAREQSSMDEQDQDGDRDDSRSAKKPRRNWTRGQAACIR
jgi:hypothetical protein